jgi:hypothetical protein
MLSDLIWWISTVLELVLLAAGIRGKLAHRFPVFYSYVAFVVLQDVVRFLSLQWTDGVYKGVYWITEFLGLALGSLVVLEICKISLAAYPGTARMARNALAFIFVLAIAKGLASAPGMPISHLRSTVLEMERALRTVQAAAILALVILFLVYSIPFGKNLRGILLGYGLFIGERVICLAFVSQQDHDFWFYAYSGSYIAALGLWLGHLWSYQPSPQPNVSVELENDYQRIAAATQRRFQEARGQLRKAVRS